jgi:uncharacterized protein YqcC (DUF446 family)
VKVSRARQIISLLAALAVAVIGLETLYPPRLLGRFWAVGLIIWVIAMVGLMTLAIAVNPSNRRLPVRRASSPSHAAVAQKIAEIEAEMRRLGLWQAEPLAPECYNFTQAFAADTMSIDQWLQFIFIPRVREIIERVGEFPPTSSVAPRVLREFDGSPFDITTLHLRLYEFDRLFD